MLLFIIIIQSILIFISIIALIYFNDRYNKIYKQYKGYTYFDDTEYKMPKVHDDMKIALQRRNKL